MSQKGEGEKEERGWKELGRSRAQNYILFLGEKRLELYNIFCAVDIFLCTDSNNNNIFAWNEYLPF